MCNQWKIISIVAGISSINHLIAVGDTISEKEQIMYVIGGLDANYNSLITIVRHKDRQITLN